MPNARRRPYRIRVKWRWDIVARRLKKLYHIPWKPTSKNPPDEWAWEWEVLEVLEQRTFALFASMAVPTAQWDFYMGFTKRVWERGMLVESATFEKELTSLINEYVLRGWAQNVLLACAGIAITAVWEKKEGMVLEPIWNTWTLVWSHDFGAGAALEAVVVSNVATVGVLNNTGPSYDLYVLDYNEAVVHEPAPYYPQAMTQGLSIFGMYALAQPTATQFDVWREALNIFSRDTALDNADVSAISAVVGYKAISPNGHFIAIIGRSTATGNNRYVLLYEGQK